MKKYQLIYADPPWPVSKIIRESRPKQVDMDYPTMTLKEIKCLPVESIADENSSLFLWTTHKYLPDSFDVMKAWGFKYQRTITWDKQNGMCLFGFHHRTEFLLFGYRGKIQMYPERKAIPTLIIADSFRHSEKPDVIRKTIEIFGKTRIELFARKRREGWDCWGNEVESDIQLEPPYDKIARPLNSQDETLRRLVSRQFETKPF